MVTNNPLNPTMQSYMNEFGDGLRSIICNAMPGKISSYDAKLGTSSIEIMCQQQTASGKIKPYPQLVDVPVMQLSGSLGGVNIPIAKGDDCLVIFGDRDIDNWYATGSAQVPNSARVHSLADGFAIVGFRPLTNAPVRPDYLATGLYRDATQVSIKNNKIALKNGTTDLKTIIDAVISHINSIIVTPISLGSPATISFGTPAPTPGDLLYQGDNTTP